MDHWHGYKKFSCVLHSHFKKEIFIFTGVVSYCVYKLHWLDYSSTVGEYKTFVASFIFMPIDKFYYHILVKMKTIFHLPLDNKLQHLIIL